MMDKETKKPEEVATSCVGTLVLLVALMVGGTILNGWVLSLLWIWFVVPLFHMAALSVPASCGVALVAGFLTKQASIMKDEYEDRAKIYAYAIAGPLLTLLFGWVIHQFVR